MVTKYLNKSKLRLLYYECMTQAVRYVAGQSPRRLMTGFMLTTMFMSMWISNTAATAMMVPIVDAVLQQLYKVNKQKNTLISCCFHCTAALLVIKNHGAYAVKLYEVNNNHEMLQRTWSLFRPFSYEGRCGSVEAKELRRKSHYSAHFYTVTAIWHHCLGPNLNIYIFPTKIYLH